MGNPVHSHCFVCHGRVDVTELHCRHCETTVRGRFSPCKFCALSQEQQEFIEVFLTSRGNIKEVERLLKISYPTVRSRIEAVIASLGYQGPDKGQSQGKDILEALEREEISSDEAIRLLRKK